MTLNEAYDQGFIDGMTCFAHWRAGVEHVGTTGTTLKEAILKRFDIYNYKTPEEVKWPIS